MTGEIVRRRLQESGNIDYTPYVYAQDFYGRATLEPIEATWPPYLGGDTTLPQAALALMRAIR